MDTTGDNLHLHTASTGKVTLDGVGRPAAVARQPRGRWSRAGRIVVRIVSGALAVLAVAAASGATYETVATSHDAATYPPAGRLVDIGGYRLHLDCRGQGAPTVVMDAGLGGSSLDWTLVQSGLAGTTRVCTYDRAGMGWSDAGPLPRSPAHLAEELHRLLADGGIAGPYVLVAHSLAGKNARMLARAYPADVAGMVLVDARSERVDAQADAEAFFAALKGQASLYSIARRFGIARLFGAGLVEQPLVTQDLASEMVLLQTNPMAIEATTQEGLARSADDPVLAAATLGTMPLVVIAAADSMRTIPGWPEAQRALARLSSEGRLVVAEHSDHAVQLAEPEIVIGAVKDVLTAVRSQP